MSLSISERRGQLDQAHTDVNLRDLHALRRAGLLSARQFVPACDAIRDEAFWARWGSRALLALGAGQFLAGVVFFFAYNWNDLSDIAKFAVVESGLIVAAVAALIHGIDRPFGQVLLIAAAIMTGVLLAVIGQVYQTGADVFELFAAWAVLILPWVLAGRSAALWLLWVAVAAIALGLYGEQVLVVMDRLTSEEVWAMVGAALALVLTLREVALRHGLGWLGPEWLRLTLLIAAVATLFAPAAGFVLDLEPAANAVTTLAPFPIAVAVGGWSYWRRLPDFAAMVILTGFVDAFVICIGYRLIEESIGFDFDRAETALGSSGAMILWAVAATGGAALVMRHLRGEMKAGMP